MAPVRPYTEGYTIANDHANVIWDGVSIAINMDKHRLTELAKERLSKGGATLSFLFLLSWVGS